MSTYHGRRAPNVSHLLQDLNSIDTVADDNFNMEDDLELFTNTQFYDFDSGQQTDFQAQPTKAALAAAASRASTDVIPSAAASTVGDVPNLDFSMPGEFAFNDFTSPYPSFPEGPQNFQSLQHGHGPVYGTPAATSPTHPYPQHGAPTPDSRKASTPNGGRPVNMEEASRHAAEEDKRRRNTAASARFRVKKKQREQALEKSAKEMTDKLNALESKVSQLETENKWLKNLLVDKNEGNDEIAGMWKEFTKYAGERKKSGAKTSDDR